MVTKVLHRGLASITALISLILVLSPNISLAYYVGNWTFNDTTITSMTLSPDTVDPNLHFYLTYYSNTQDATGLCNMNGLNTSINFTGSGYTSINDYFQGFVGSTLGNGGVGVDSNCLNAGYYNLIIRDYDTGDILYLFTTYYDGVSTAIPLSSESPTQITAFNVSTTTNTVNIQGIMNISTTTLSGSPEWYDQLIFYTDSTLLGQQDFISTNATTSGVFNLTFDYNNLPSPSTGTTTQALTADQNFYAKIYRYDNNYYSDPFSGIVNPLYKTLLVATSTTITATTTDTTFNIDESIYNYPEYECGITSMTGCIKNALIWLFYPSKGTFERYYSFMDLLKSKAPFGYFFVVTDELGGINKDTTPAFNVTIPQHLKDVIFNPFDQALAILLWAFYLFNLYRRLKHIQI